MSQATQAGGAPFSERGTLGKTGLVVGSMACTSVYTPVKAAYAAGGAVAGGLVFLMSAGQSSTAGGKMVQKSTGGDWFIHPDHLTGNRPLEFKGNAPDQTSHFYR
jgi:hypothetical protein